MKHEKRTAFQQHHQTFLRYQWPFDEYKQRETEFLGNRSFVFLFWLLVPASLLAYFAGIRFPSITALVFPVFVILIFSGVYLRILFKLQKNKLTETDLEEWTPAERKALRHTGLKAGLLWGIILFILTCLLSYVLEGSIFVFLHKGRALAVWFGSTLVFASSLHFSAKKTLQKKDDI